MSEATDDDMTPGAVDPMDFLAALLRLSPEDAKRVRDATPPPPKRADRKHDDDSEYH